MRSAVMLQQAGRLNEARKLYEQVLRRDPHNAEALHLLGLVLIDHGEANKGLQLLRRAISYAPDAIEVVNNLAVELCRLGRIAEALPLYDKLLARDAHQPGVQLNRALALRDLGRPQEALAALDALIATTPGHALARSARGSIRAALGHPADALADFDAALAIDTTNAECHSNRANALMALRRFADAVDAFDHALTHRPADPASLHRRGVSLHALDRETEALASFEAALDAGGDGPDLLTNLATTLAVLGRHAEAGGYFRAAMAARPGDAEALFGLANVFLALQNHEAALEHFDAGLAARPGFAPALHNRATTLIHLGQYSQAATALTDLLRIAPGTDYARGERLFARLFCCNWTEYETELAAITASVMRGDRAASPFMALAHTASAEVQRRCAQTYTNDVAPTVPPVPGHPAKTDGKIHIAYLSRDLRNHAVSFLMAGVFERHDRTRFDVTAISFAPADDSPLGQRVHNAFDRFIDVSAKTDTETAALMRDIGVDIAIDLMGHTQGSRPGILAQRPAPVQVNYLGYPGTMGADYIDAIIADADVIPPGHDRFYTETVIRLPTCFQANDDQRRAGPAPSRAEAGLPPSGFVFCCFARSYKITPAIFGIAMRLLLATPGSVLWLAPSTQEARTNLTAAAAAQGVNPARLIFAGQVDYAAHLARLTLADLVLDTFPFNGGTTVSDALWGAGVPVVTLAGEAFASRMGASLLHAAGLPGFITTGPAAYEQCALDLAGNPTALAAARKTLQTSATTLDTRDFCRELEAALAALHRAASPVRQHDYGLCRDA
jgi:predicted O-linked N-acetylglucosamine transferase (SPINDLY family)